jgi:hypothetical protein
MQLNEAQALSKEQRQAAADEQVKLLGGAEIQSTVQGVAGRGGKGEAEVGGAVGTLQEFADKLSSGSLEGGDYSAAGKLAQRLSQGYNIKGKAGGAVRGAYGAEATGFAQAASAVDAVLKRTAGKGGQVAELSRQFGVSKDELEGISKTGRFDTEEAKQRLKGLVAVKGLQRGRAGQRPQVDPTLVTTTFEKFRETMKDTGQVMKDAASVFKQIADGTKKE